MILRLTSGSVPIGTYNAKFVCVEPAEDGQYGPGLRWTFEIISGPHTGSRISKKTGLEPKTTTACGRMLVAISGKSIEGVDIDLSTYIGRPYLIVVGPRSDGKGTCLESVCFPPNN